MRVLLAADAHIRDFRFRKSDGSYRWVRVEQRLLRGADGAPSEIVGSWADETQVRGLKENFHRAQKMEAVGRLAGGIAHDFNNVLSAVTGYAQLLLDQLDAADPRWHEANEIAEAGRRGAELIRHLMAFSREQVIQPEIISIDAVVANMENMLRPLIGADVQLAIRPGPAPGRVRADRGQLEQVLMNLVVNARDAMPEGGRLTIATRGAELTNEDVLRYDYVLPGQYVLLEVADTGHGMSEDTQSRIFEPFFTTKEEGKGTGLGLASVYGIVKQSGGYIWVASRPGEGTTFSIYLPLVDAAEPAATPASAPLSDASPEAPAVVLLVEDQPSVRALVRRVLEARGHRVLEAAGGPEALQLAAAHAGPIDLLLTDVVMPQMNGLELAQRLTTCACSS